MVFAQGVMCGWDLIERELARNVHVKRPVTYEVHEALEQFSIGLAVERLRFDARCRGRLRLDAGGVRRPPTRPDRRHDSIGLWASRGEERGVEFVGGESAHAIGNLLGPSVDR